MDPLAALRLQLEWGADEALDTRPIARTGPPADLHPAALPSAAPGPALAVVPATGVAARAEAAAARAGSLGDLERELAAFDGCSLAVTATSMAFGAGPTGASLMVVGDAPGADEDRLGRPFAGREGELLERMLGSIGVAWDGARLALVVPWRPPGGRPPTPAEIAACVPFLHRQVALVAPRHLVAIGALPARALLGEAANPTRNRGRLVAARIPGLEGAIPTLLLAPLQQFAKRSEYKANAWAGLRQLRRALDRAPD